MMTESEARKALAEVRAPKLDTLRANIPKMSTSGLLGLLINTEALHDLLDEDGSHVPKSGPPKFPTHKYTMEEEAMIVAAAAIAISDEIDRRIPIP